MDTFVADRSKGDRGRLSDQPRDTSAGELSRFDRPRRDSSVAKDLSLAKDRKVVDAAIAIPDLPPTSQDWPPPNPDNWVAFLGGGGIDDVQGLVLDAAGNSYVTGRFSDQATLGSTKLTSNGVTDMFVAKLSPEGKVLWARSGGGSGLDEPTAIARDSASGQLYVVGLFSGQATFDAQTISSKGSSDLFVAKYDASGVLLWVIGAGGTGSDTADRVRVSATGGIYIAGEFSDSVTLGATTLTAKGGYDE